MDYYDSNNNLLVGCTPAFGDNIQIGTEIKSHSYSGCHGNV